MVFPWPNFTTFPYSCQETVPDTFSFPPTAANPLADITRSQSWNLDALGNFESLANNDGTPVSRTHNLQNQVTGVSGANLDFDANGNMTVDEQGRTFIWDAWNRLVEVKQGSTTLVEYKYDGLKRRIVEDDGTNEKHFYYSDQWQVLEERVGGDTITQYVWSAVYVDAMILQDRDADANTGNGLEERIYVLHDANYNVTALVDTSGDVIERYYYEAYGRAVYLDGDFELLPDGQSEHGWQHLHQGGRLDVATGNYHFRHRDLSHSLGRWISQDPIGFEAGDANLYRYVNNAPTVFVDPNGKSLMPPPGDPADDKPATTNQEFSAGEFFKRIGKGIGNFIRQQPEIKEQEDRLTDKLRDDGRKVVDVGKQLFRFVIGKGGGGSNNGNPPLKNPDFWKKPSFFDRFKIESFKPIFKPKDLLDPSQGGTIGGEFDIRF